MIYLRELRQTELPPVAVLPLGEGIQLLVDADILGAAYGQGERVALLEPLDVNGAVDANAGEDVGKLWEASQKTSTVLVDVLLARLEVPFAAVAARAAGNCQT